MPTLIGVPRETARGERRVALVPEVVARLVTAGFEVVVESGAGLGAYHDDGAYQAAGARVGDRAAALGADVVACVAPPEDVELLRPDAALVGMLRPLDDDGGDAATRAHRGNGDCAEDGAAHHPRAQDGRALREMVTVAGFRRRCCWVTERSW
jgi:NAD(P) transhydrogenase subunit alpha